MNNKKINILHLQNYLNISCGISRTIYSIINNTTQTINHLIFCFGGDDVKKFKKINECIVILKKGNLNLFFWNLIKLIYFVKKNNIQIIHSHHRYFDLLAFIASKIIKVKTITSVQSIVTGKKLFSYKSDNLITCSKNVKNHLINYFDIDKKRIKVIYNFIDKKNYQVTKSKDVIIDELELQKDLFIIGYFGRINYHEKGINLLLQAFRLLSKSYNNLYLLLIGNGEDEEKVKKYINENEFKAKVVSSKNEIQNYYQILDLFVLPSRLEPFGIVILEAGYFNIPVIASNVNGIPEIIEDEKDGLLFVPENVQHLVNQMRRLIDKKDFAERMSNNLKNKINSQFTSEIVIPEYLDFYKKILDVYNVIKKVS